MNLNAQFELDAAASPWSDEKRAAGESSDCPECKSARFVANAGTYEVSGTTMTLRAIVAKIPRAQSEKNFTKLTFKLDGNTLWLTPMETEAGTDRESGNVEVRPS